MKISELKLGAIYAIQGINPIPCKLVDVVELGNICAVYGFGQDEEKNVFFVAPECLRLLTPTEIMLLPKGNKSSSKTVTLAPNEFVVAKIGDNRKIYLIQRITQTLNNITISNILLPEYRIPLLNRI